MLLMSGSIWIIKNVRKQASKASSISHTLPNFKDVFLLLGQELNLKGKSSISSVLIFPLPMPGNESTKPGDSQKPKITAAGNYWGYCLLSTLISCGSCEDDRVRSHSESIRNRTNKIHPWAPLSLPFFTDFSASKNFKWRTLCPCVMWEGTK